MNFWTYLHRVLISVGKPFKTAECAMNQFKHIIIFNIIQAVFLEMNVMWQFSNAIAKLYAVIMAIFQCLIGTNLIVYF